MKQQEGALTDIVEELERSAGETDGGAVEVGHLVDALDHRGYGAALAILPLIELTPVGGIPGFPTLLALTLATITVRLLMGYERFWVPGRTPTDSAGQGGRTRSLRMIPGETGTDFFCRAFAAPITPPSASGSTTPQPEHLATIVTKGGKRTDGRAAWHTRKQAKAAARGD